MAAMAQCRGKSGTHRRSMPLWSPMQLVIWGQTGSTYTANAIITAIEHDADYELRVVNLRTGEQKQSAHLARNPYVTHPAAERRVQATISKIRGLTALCLLLAAAVSVTSPCCRKATSLCMSLAPSRAISTTRAVTS